MTVSFWEKKQGAYGDQQDRGQKPWYFTPRFLALGLLLTILSLISLADMLKDDKRLVSTYRAELSVALDGNKINVKDTIRLPDNSHGATGYVRYIPGQPLDQRGTAGSYFVEGIKAAVDKKDLMLINAGTQTGYLYFGQDGDEKDFYYGHQFSLDYTLVGAIKKQNAARYATIQLLNKRLNIEANRIEILIYFPSQIENPKETAQLYVGGFESKHLAATGRTHGNAKNIVEISLEQLDISKKDVFVKLTWLDLRSDAGEE